MNINIKKIVAIILIVLSLPLIMVGTPKLIDMIKTPPKNISEEEAKELFKYIPSIDNKLYDIFQNKKINQKDLPTQLLYNNVFNNMEESDMRGSIDYDVEEENCSNEGGIYIKDNCYIYDLYKSMYYFFDEGMLNKLMIKYYGSNIRLTSPKEVRSTSNITCELIEEKYFCYSKSSWMDKGDSKSIIKLDTYQLNQDIVTLNVKYIYAVYSDEDSSGNIIVKLYDKKGGTEIGSTYTFDTNMIFDKYEDKASTYKNTYLKDKDGNFYWYSIEPVK